MKKLLFYVIILISIFSKPILLACDDSLHTVISSYDKFFFYYINKTDKLENIDLLIFVNPSKIHPIIIPIPYNTSVSENKKIWKIWRVENTFKSKIELINLRNLLARCPTLINIFFIPYFDFLNLYLNQQRIDRTFPFSLKTDKYINLFNCLINDSHFKANYSVCNHNEAVTKIKEFPNSTAALDLINKYKNNFKFIIIDIDKKEEIYFKKRKDHISLSLTLTTDKIFIPLKYISLNEDENIWCDIFINGFLKNIIFNNAQYNHANIVIEPHSNNSFSSDATQISYRSSAKLFDQDLLLDNIKSNEISFLDKFNANHTYIIIINYFVIGLISYIIAFKQISIFEISIILLGPFIIIYLYLMALLRKFKNNNSSPDIPYLVKVNSDINKILMILIFPNIILLTTAIVVAFYQNIYPFFVAIPPILFLCGYIDYFYKFYRPSKDFSIFISYKELKYVFIYITLLYFSTFMFDYIIFIF